MRVIGLPYWGVHVEARRQAAQQRDLRHDDPVDLREHGHRGRAARARRRQTASRTAPGRQPVHGAGRPLASAASRAALQAPSADAVRPAACVDARPLPENDNYGGPRGRRWTAPTRRRRPSEVGDRRLPLRARRPVDDRDDRHPDGEARRRPALHQPRRRGDLPHGHLVQVPVPRADRRGVPARRRRDEQRAARSTSTPPSSGFGIAGDRRARRTSSTGTCR